ncbi:MAG: O-antigen ligase family protein [Magnetococcales bacterium]|nr:O-antigen ligase family protein [Magnetococcales bacterium]
MAENIRPVIKKSITPAADGPGHRWLLRGYLLLLFWAPLPLGSNRPWAWGLMESWVFLLLTVWLIQRWLRQPLQDPLQDAAVRPFRLVMLLWLLALLYPLWQTIPWPTSLLTMLSPTTVSVRQLVGVSPQAGTISLDPHLTLVEWLKGISYLGIFWLTLVLPRTRQAVRQVTWVMLASGVTQVGISILSLDGSAATHDVHGSFVNRNHLAGFLELVLPVAIGLLRSNYQATGAASGWRDRFHHGLEMISGPPGVLFGVSVAMVITLFLTQSRGGNGSLLLAFLLVATLPRAKNTRHPHLSSRVRAGVLLLTLFFIVINSTGLGHLVGRYLDTDIQQEGRLAVLQTATGIIKDYPLFGSGSGTFVFVYPRYQPESLSQALFDHAHNDHLELITERGIIGYGLLAAALLHCWWIIARAYHSRRDSLASALLYASLVATLSLVIHGLTDFNFQIPANALYFMVMLAVGLQGVGLAPANRRVI